MQGSYVKEVYNTSYGFPINPVRLTNFLRSHEAFAAFSRALAQFFQRLLLGCVEHGLKQAVEMLAHGSTRRDRVAVFQSVEDGTMLFGAGVRVMHADGRIGCLYVGNILTHSP